MSVVSVHAREVMAFRTAARDICGKIHLPSRTSLCNMRLENNQSKRLATSGLRRATLDKGNEEGDDGHEARSSRNNDVVGGGTLGAASRRGAAAGSRGGSAAAGVGNGTLAVVLALDVIGSVELLEGGAVGGNVGRRLDVEGTTDIGERGEDNSVQKISGCGKCEENAITLTR